MTVWFIKVFWVLWEQRKALFGISAFIFYFTGFINEVVVTGFNILVDILATSDFSYLGNIDLSIIEGIAVANGFLPLGEAVSLLLLYYGSWIAWIIFRNIKSFIPTVSN